MGDDYEHGTRFHSAYNAEMQVAHIVPTAYKLHDADGQIEKGVLLSECRKDIAAMCLDIYAIRNLGAICWKDVAENLQLRLRHI